VLDPGDRRGAGASRGPRRPRDLVPRLDERDGCRARASDGPRPPHGGVAERDRGDRPGNRRPGEGGSRRAHRSMIGPPPGRRSPVIEGERAEEKARLTSRTLSYPLGRARRWASSTACETLRPSSSSPPSSSYGFESWLSLLRASVGSTNGTSFAATSYPES